MNYLMMKTWLTFVCIVLSVPCWSQALRERLSVAIDLLQSDEQFKHGQLSLYVVNSKTGEVVFNKNGQTGLAPASCQKIVTSVAAFEFLGKDYTYETMIGYEGEIIGNVLNGSVWVVGSGDPTLGSWRWKQTGEDLILGRIVSSIIAKGLSGIKGGLRTYTNHWETNTIPAGWIWEDIGNYYGAGTAALNWRENQYDIVMRAGRLVGDKISIIKTSPEPVGVDFTNELRTGKKGSGDNAYIYLPPYSTKGFIRGTIPAEENNFTISGSFPDPARQFAHQLSRAIKNKNIEMAETPAEGRKQLPVDIKQMLTIHSPSLDSMNYWFLKKSINLYGEAFVKTIAYNVKKIGSTDTGIAIIKEFWSRRGVEKPALKIIDGSGLSPANRITTHALVTILQYAAKQSWYISFYNALPEMNGVKMKDGYIGGVRSYTGYITSKTGTKYTFAFIVNNFDGSPGSAREKMWKVLDILK